MNAKSPTILVKFFVSAVMFLALVLGLAIPMQTALAADPPPTFGNNYTIAGSASGLDATVDSLGNLYSAYESGGNVYIKKNLGETELVSPGSGPAIAIDSSNNIHVIYVNSGLQYKKKTGTVWGSERAVTGGTVFYSIDTDSTGAAHIASDDGGTGGRGHIVYVKDNGGTWSDPIREWTGWYDSGSGNYYHLPVIRIDSEDKYHLAFEADNWGGRASWSDRSINIASNSTYGDIGVGGFDWNAGVGLTRNSLTLKGADAYIAYTNGGTQNIALVNSSWTVLSSFAGSAGSAYYKSGVVGVSYVDGNVKYIEDAGAGFSTDADLGAGSSPVALLGSRYVFFQSGTDIKLASSQAFDPAKAITAFDFNALSPAVIGVVTEGAKTVALTVPFGTNVTALVPTITITGASVNPASGAAHNFTTPQTYTVTAADASTQDYTVTVTQIPPTGTVVINPEPDAMNATAPWILTGPNSYSRTGIGDLTLNNLAAGNYTITWGDVSGWIKPSPASETKALTNGGTTTFNGTYVHQTIPVIYVTPSSLNFGIVPVRSTKDLSLTVQNTGIGTLTGTATTDAPFSIVSGASYSLGPDQSQVVTIRYQPTSPGTHTGAVVFTGGDGATVPVSSLSGLPWLMLLLGD